MKKCALLIVPALVLCLSQNQTVLADNGTAKAEFAGTETCLTCHQNREDFKDNIHAKSWPKAKNIEFAQSCETCHGPGSLHAAAGGDKSNPGFATIKNPQKMGHEEANASCLTCHEKGKRALWKGSMHESKGLSCNKCHSIHGGHDKNLAKADSKEICFQCHKDVKSAVNKTSHHPIIEGKISCVDCHNPHGSAGPKLLSANTVNEKCYECHAEKRGPYLFEHRPVSEDCTICHTPHGSKNNKLLTKRAPYLCQSCHSNSRHPGTLYAINPATVGSNTYQKLNTRVLYRACLNCHNNIHGSNHPSGVYFMR